MRAHLSAAICGAGTLVLLVACASTQGLSQQHAGSQRSLAERGSVAAVAPRTATPSASQRAVPWRDAPAPPLPTPSMSTPIAPPSNARPCRSSDVSARLDGRNGAGGHLIRYVIFTNTSRSDCLLAGYPRVVATEPGRQDVTGTTGSWFGVGHSANMRPGATTELGLETDTYCAARPGGGGPADPYRHIRISLPGGGTIALATFGAKTLDLGCGLRVRAFAVPDYPQPQPIDPLWPLRATLDVPRSARAGSTMTFAVALRNPTGHEVPLVPCPGYVEALISSADSKQSYALNCSSVKAIGAHRTVRYTMRLPVPADTRPGPTRVFWALVYGQGVTGTQTVSITN